MKKILFVIIVFLGVFVALTITGLYPIAFVGRHPISSRTFQKLEESSKYFANIELARAGKQTIDFSASSNADLLLQGRREVLTSLVEDTIIELEGGRLVADLENKSSARVDSALAGRAGALEKEAPLVYKLSLEELKTLVLMPQARRDVLRDELQKNGEDFSQWLTDTEQEVSVRLFFIPFSWDGKEVR